MTQQSKKQSEAVRCYSRSLYYKPQKKFVPVGVLGWRSGESARLPPMCPGFDSRTRCHMWVEFVVGSHPSSEGFSPGSPVFLPPQKSTFLNSNSIGNSRATGLSVVDCNVLPSLNKVNLLFILLIGSGKQMLYVLNIIVRYSLIYVGTKDRQFLTFIHSFDLLF